MLQIVCTVYVYWVISNQAQAQPQFSIRNSFIVVLARPCRPQLFSENQIQFVVVEVIYLIRKKTTIFHNVYQGT